MTNIRESESVANSAHPKRSTHLHFEASGVVAEAMKALGRGLCRSLSRRLEPYDDGLLGRREGYYAWILRKSLLAKALGRGVSAMSGSQ